MSRVERSVQTPDERQQVVRALDRFGRDVDVFGRVERDRHADGRGEVTGPQAAGEDDRLGLDVAAIGAHAGHRAVFDQQGGDLHTLSDRHAAIVRALREGERGVPRVHGAVAGLEERADEAVGGDERPHLGDLSGFEQTGLDPVVTGDRGRVPELRHPAVVLGERERARRPEVHVDSRLLREPPVQVDPVVRQLGHRVRAPNARDEPRGVPRGARRDPRPLQKHHVRDPEVGEVIRDRRPSDPTTDDHDLRTAWQRSIGRIRSERRGGDGVVQHPLRHEAEG